MAHHVGFSHVFFAKMSKNIHCAFHIAEFQRNANVDRRYTNIHGKKLST